MKKVLIALVAIAILSVAVVTHAQFKWGGYGMGHGMMWSYERGNDYQKFLDETVALRKQFLEKRFAYNEALRNPETRPDVLVKLEEELVELEKKIYEKSPAPQPRGKHGRGGRDRGGPRWFSCPMW